jgi:hypothetical protein
VPYKKTELSIPKTERGFVMKSSIKLASLCLAASLVALPLTACGGNNANNQANTNTPAASSQAAPSTTATGKDALVGSWEYQGGGYTYTFNADGTGTYDISGNVMKFTYEATDSKLSITYEGNTAPMTLDYSISGKVLNVKDSNGADTLYNRK